MKKLIQLGLAFSSLMTLNVNAMATEVSDRDVLQAIDDICGDSWCEGDYNYSFNEVIFTANGFTLKYDLLDQKKSFSYECHLPQYLTASAAVERHDVFLKLTYDFYHDLSACFSQNEEVTRSLTADK